MSFKRFLRTIIDLVPYDPLNGREDALARLNPEKIYIENVRSVLGVSAKFAERICETAVRQGVFHRHIEVICPDGAVAVSVSDESTMPKTVKCWLEENGEIQQAELFTDDLKKVRFYSMTDEGTTKLHAHPA